MYQNQRIRPFDYCHPTKASWWQQLTFLLGDLLVSEGNKDLVIFSTPFMRVEASFLRTSCFPPHCPRLPPSCVSLTLAWARPKWWEDQWCTWFWTKCPHWFKQPWSDGLEDRPQWWARAAGIRWELKTWVWEMTSQAGLRWAVSTFYTWWEHQPRESYHPSLPHTSKDTFAFPFPPKSQAYNLVKTESLLNGFYRCRRAAVNNSNINPRAGTRPNTDHCVDVYIWVSHQHTSGIREKQALLGYNPTAQSKTDHAGDALFLPLTP